MSETVAVRIKIDDSGSFKRVEVNAGDLRNAVRTVKDEADRLNASIVNWAQAAQSAQMLQSAIMSVQSAFSELAGSYNEGQTQIARLGQAMRNTMSASREEVDSILRLCEAQERMGVTSKEAQLAGAQELATYLELPSSLQLLIPVLNDMAAQQLGVGASGESVAQIASMLGKVMNGQTEALSRYGYKFDEAQKHILQFGEESARAAVLAQVVGDSVGGMSHAVRNSAEGALFAAQTRIDNMTESVGALASRIQPAVNSLASFSMAAVGITKVVATLRSLNGVMAISKVQSAGLAVAVKVQSAAMRIVGVTATTAATKITALRIATAALYAGITLGLSVAITALVALISRLAKKSAEAAEDVGRAKEATDAYRDAASGARSEITKDIVETEKLIRQKADESGKVRDLNERYGEIFGHYGTLAEWYDVLTTKSEAYCRQLGYQAKAEKLIQQNSRAIVELDEIRKQKKALEDSGKTSRKGMVFVPGAMEQDGGHYEIQNVPTRKYSKLIAQEKKLEASIRATTRAMQEASSEAEKASDDLKSKTDGITKMTPGSGAGQASAVKGLAEDIADYRTQVQRAMEVNEAFNGSFGQNAVELKAMQSGLTSLIGKYGLENDAVRALVDEYNALALSRAKAMMSGSLAVSGNAGGGSASAMSTPGLAKATKEIKDYTSAQEAAAKRQSEMQQGLGAIAGAFSSLGNAVGEAAGAWMEWAGNLVSAISQAIPSIAALVAAKKTEAAANTAAAASGAGSAVAGIPFVGPAMAVAAILSVIAALASVPKFAGGGIAYGPTLGLFGEYAGASGNPEVVAPLDRLRSLLGFSGDLGGRVVFRIRGRDLEGVLTDRNNLTHRG